MSGNKQTSVKAKDGNVRGIAKDIEGILDRVFSYRDAGACVIDCTGMRVRITRQQVCVGTTKHEGTFEGAFTLYQGDIIHIHVFGAFRQNIVLEIKAHEIEDVRAVKGEDA